MDKWVESGRQLVDGVAGNRPGQRRKDNRSGFNNMGRWVEEKIDWFFEEEDDWSTPIEFDTDVRQTIPITKRPLQAISLRVPKALSAADQENVSPDVVDQWPDDSSFRVERWERDSLQEQDGRKTKGLENSTKQQKIQGGRPLPRSSRRRN
ncbi:putative Viral (Superfamily 1) RNA helicase [Prochlorococcus sp. SS52]|nr:putative Viral (Superfamily 1) RNA helicase [Prochlorococcus sp. SS52]